MIFIYVFGNRPNSQKLSHRGFTFHVCTAYNIAIIKTGNAVNAPLGTNRCKGGRLAEL